LLPNDRIKISGDTTYREILTVNSNTSITLKTNVVHANASGLTYLTNVFIGTGTSWLTGAAADKLNVNDWLRIGPIGSRNPYLIVGVDSDTRVRVYTNVLGANTTFTGEALKTYPQADQRANTTSPLFQQGVIPTSTDCTGVQLGDSNILRGGTYCMNTGAGTNIPTGPGILKAPSTFSNNAVSDWLNGPLNAASSVVCAYGNINLLTGVNVGGTINPIPTTPTVTSTKQFETAIRLAWANQGSGTIYEFRSRTTAGPGAWSAWTLVSTLVNKTVVGLTGTTSYDFEVRGKNCLSEDGVTYLQVGTAGSLTASTTAAGAYETETTALLATFTGTPTSYRKDLINGLIYDLKNAPNGNLFTKFDFFHVYANFDADSAKHNWVNPGTYDATIVGSPTFLADRHYTNSSGSNYISTGCKGPFTGGNKSTQNDNDIGFWRRDNTPANNDIAGNAELLIGARQFAATPWGRNGDTTNDGGSFVANRTDGLWVNTRNNSANFNFWGNNGSVAPTGTESTLLGTQTRTSTAPSNSEIVVLAGNTNVAGAITIALPQAAAQIAVAFCGASLSAGNVADLDAALYNYLAAIGAA